MRKLKPNATFEDVQKYLEQLQKKTSKVLRSDKSCSWLRGPYYDLEEEALVMSKSLTDGYARISLVMGVIEDMAVLLRTWQEVACAATWTFAMMDIRFFTICVMGYVL